MTFRLTVNGQVSELPKLRIAPRKEDDGSDLAHEVFVPETIRGRHLERESLIGIDATIGGKSMAYLIAGVMVVALIFGGFAVAEAELLAGAV